MIWLLRLLDGAISAAERVSTAERLERRGFRRCDEATFRARWRERDREAFERLQNARQQAAQTAAPAPASRLHKGERGE